jgi:hypothetical protein
MLRFCLPRLSELAWRKVRPQQSGQEQCPADRDPLVGDSCFEPREDQMSTRKQKLRAAAAVTPLGETANVAAKKTVKVKKTSRGK